MEPNNKGYIKQRTLELYALLPMDLEERQKQTAIRDEILKLNYKFFGYVAKETYVANAEYEDKFQTAWRIRAKIAPPASDRI